MVQINKTLSVLTFRGTLYIVNVHNTCEYVSAEQLNVRAQSPEENERDGDEEKQKLNGSSPEKSLVQNYFRLCLYVLS